MKIIVGLGNPGKKYAGSRHNVGFQCVDILSKKLNIKLSDRRAKAVLGQGTVAEHQVVLGKPRTFMNNSGDGIEYLLTRFSSRPDDLVVIYDEMALPVGRVRIRRGGGDAGHNGIASIIQATHTHEFPRIRVGIGKPSGGGDVGHVLGAFSSEEKPLIQAANIRAADAIVYLLESDIEATMNRFNGADPE